jgi:hypothetical protein
MDEPHSLVRWMRDQHETLEKQVKKALLPWCEGQPICQWSRSICGIDVILAAGLAANLDIEGTRTVSRWWRFAGLDPRQEWLGAEKSRAALNGFLDGGYALDDCIPLLAARIGTRPDTLLRLATSTRAPDGTIRQVKLTADSLAKAGAKRPWNASLKMLLWKVGESFVKVSGNEKDFYGKYYLKRKAGEIVKNENGDFADQAKAKLAKFKLGADTDARSWYGKGKLPPAHIHARAKRWAVKLFLSHYHEVAYRLRYNEAPPVPYPIGVKGHADYIPPPNWPM